MAVGGKNKVRNCTVAVLYLVVLGWRPDLVVSGQSTARDATTYDALVTARSDAEAPAAQRLDRRTQQRQQLICLPFLPRIFRAICIYATSYRHVWHIFNHVVPEVKF